MHVPLGVHVHMRICLCTHTHIIGRPNCIPTCTVVGALCGDPPPRTQTGLCSGRCPAKRTCTSGKCLPLVPQAGFALNSRPRGLDGPPGSHSIKILASDLTPEGVPLLPEPRIPRRLGGSCTETAPGGGGLRPGRGAGGAPPAVCRRRPQGRRRAPWQRPQPPSRPLPRRWSAPKPALVFRAIFFSIFFFNTLKYFILRVFVAFFFNVFWSKGHPGVEPSSVPVEYQKGQKPFYLSFRMHYVSAMPGIIFFPGVGLALPRFYAFLFCWKFETLFRTNFEGFF